MKNPETIQIELENKVATIWLNRPNVMNAFNGLMVQELVNAFEEISKNDAVKIVVLRGRGKVFCSGADLTWMHQVSELSYEKNFMESQLMARCLYLLFSMPKPVVTLAHGTVMGGGNGLVAASDICICSKSTNFAFTEVRLGLVPAVISPYIIRRIGHSRARELMLTGRKFDGSEAAQFNLVTVAVEDYELEEFLNNYVNQLQYNSGSAMNKTKELLTELTELYDTEAIMRYTARAIAQARVSRDGQEGISAYFEKRKPIWN